MAEYRRVTAACAKRDGDGCRTHVDVMERHGSSDLFKQFVGQQTSTWYAGEAVRDRSRDAEGQARRPGPRLIGSFKVDGYRAWVWKDDGSVFGLDNFDGFHLNWMIAFGNRRRDDRSDLQEKCKHLLLDPEDSWRPDLDDYKSLLEEHDQGFTERAVRAVSAALAKAGAEHNTIVPISSPEIGGNVVHEHDEDPAVAGRVIVEINEIWIILDQNRPDGRFLRYEDALLIASASVADDVELEPLFDSWPIRGDLYRTDPAKEWIFYVGTTE